MNRTQPLSAPRWMPLAAIAAACLIALAGLYFRALHSLSEPLWLDEAYSAYAAAKGFGFLWHIVPLYETHPPFYYSLVRVWTLVFGDSLASLRGMSLLASMATLAIVAVAARALARLHPQRFGNGIGLTVAAVLLAALAPSTVEMAREVRPYPVLILVYAGTLAALLVLARVAAEERRIAVPAFVAYLVCLALMLWLHNLGPLYGAAIGLAFLVLVLRPGLSRRDWLLIVGGHVAVALVYLPALLILVDQASTWIKSTWLKFSFDGIRWRLALLWAAPGSIPMLCGLALAALGGLTLLQARGGWRTLIALLLLAGLPVGMSLALSVYVSPVFIPRTMTPVAIPSLMLLAVGAAGQRGLLRWVGVVVVLLLAFEMVQLDRWARTHGAKQDWYGAAHWLGERYRPGDQVWAYPNEGALPFDYAVRDLRLAIPSRSIPTPIPTLDGGPGAWNPTGSRGVFSLPPARLKAIAQAPSARAVPTIWLLRLGANAYDKGDVLLHALEPGRTRIGHFKNGPIDIVGLRRSSP